MIFVVSNRTINEDSEGENLLNNFEQDQELETVYFVEAQSNTSGASRQWETKLLNPGGINLSDPSDKQQWLSFFQEWYKSREKRHCVLAIYGYDQSFEDNLNASKILSERYDVDVINFSWPAKSSGGLPSERYERARLAAKESVSALFQALTTLEEVLQANVKSDKKNAPESVTLLVHSLGNFILENLTRDPRFEKQTHFLDSVILHQADVDNENHETWIDKLSPSRIYVTINQFDIVLGVSNVVNPQRLGNSLSNLIPAKYPCYINLTNGKNVENQHNFFTGDPISEKITLVCERLVQGLPGEEIVGFFEHDEDHNIVHLK